MILTTNTALPPEGPRLWRASEIRALLRAYILVPFAVTATTKI